MHEIFHRSMDVTTVRGRRYETFLTRNFNARTFFDTKISRTTVRVLGTLREKCNQASLYVTYLSSLKCMDESRGEVMFFMADRK